MLACHPDIATAGESHLFPEGVAQLLRNHGSHDPLMGLKTWMPRGEFLAVVRSFTDAIFSSMHAATRPDAKMVVDKTPTVRPFADELALVYPDARFIHIIRDARDMAGSVVGLWGQGRGLGAWEHAARTWVDAVNDIRSKLGTFAYHEVRYETIVADPRTELSRIFDFCDLDHDGDFVATCVAFARAPINTRPSDDRVGAGKWQDERSDALRRVIGIAGDLMIETGHLTDAERRRILKGIRPSEVIGHVVTRTLHSARRIGSVGGRRREQKSALARSQVQAIGESVANEIVNGDPAAVRAAVARALVTIDDQVGSPDHLMLGAGSKIIWVRADEQACLVQFRAPDGSRVIQRYFVTDNQITKVAVQGRPSV